ncbi:autotransporter assembly complex protein TamB [Paraglaciecola aestuariivivens]
MSEPNQTEQVAKPTSFRFSKLISGLAKFVLAFLLLLAIVVAGLFTPWGSQLSISTVNKALDELTIEYQSGGLGSELRLSSVNFKQQGIDLQLQDLTLSMQLSCVWRLAVCIEQLSVAQLHLNLAASEQSQSPESKTPLSLPFPVSLASVNIQNVRVKVEDSAAVEWQSLSAKLDFYQRLRVEKLRLDGLHISTVAAKQQNTDAEPFDWQNWQYAGIKAQPVILPIYFDLLDVKLNDLRLMLANQPELLISHLAVKAKGSAKKLQLDEFKLQHAKGKLDAKGSVQLNGEFEHQLSLDAHAKLDARPKVQLSMRSSGNIHKLSTQFVIDLNSSSTQAKPDLSTPPTDGLSVALTAKPSDSNLPIDLHASWQSLAWPLSQPQYHSKSGRLLVKGNLSDMQLSANSQVVGPSIPQTQLDLQAKLAILKDVKELAIQQLNIASLNGQISSKGKLTLAEHIEWQGQSNISEIDPSVFWPALSANINGELVSSANNRNGVWRAKLEKFELDGQWQGYPLAASGKLDYEQNQGLSIQTLQFINAQNQLMLEGKLDQQQVLDLRFVLTAPELSNSVPSLSGALHMDGSLTGSLSQPKMQYSLKANELLASGILVENATGQGTLVWDEEKPVSIELELSGIQGVSNQAERAALSLQGNAKLHELNVNTVGTDTNLQIKIQGQLFDNAWQGRWLEGDIQSTYANLQLLAPFEIKTNWQTQEYLVAPHCWQHSEHGLCVKQAEFKQNTLLWDLSVKEFDLLSVARRLMPSLPNVKTASRLNLDFAGDWHLDALPNAHLKANLSAAKWLFTQQNNLQLDIDQVRINADFSQQNIMANFNLSGQQIGSLVANVTGQAGVYSDPLNRPIEGELVIEGFDLAAFKALAPQLDRLEGNIQGQTKIAGTIGSPLLNGELALAKGALKDQGLPVALSEIEQRISLNGQSAELVGSYKLGAGKGQLSGQVRWLPEVSGQLNIAGDALEFDYQNMLKAKVSPNIDIKFEPNNLEVAGEVSIPYARIKVRELPSGSISPSKDVVLVEKQAQKQANQQRIALNLMLNIDPAKANQVKLDAFGLTTDLQGQLRLQNNKDEVFGSGEVQLVNGKYRAYGQSLLIREGDILFTNTLDRPFINIEAVRDPALTQDGVVAGVKVEGVAQNPNISVFSEPVMEQQQALSYILTGRGLGVGSGDSQDTMLTNALLSLGLGKSENLISKVGNKLGFEDVNLDTTGQGQNTQLSLTGTIAPGVQLRYGVGVFDSVSEVAIRYQLLPKLYLEAVSGVSNAIDIYYQFSLDDSTEKAQKHE